MKTYLHHILLLLEIFSFASAFAQFNPEKICRVENGRIIFTINLTWSVKEKRELTNLFDLDSTLIVQVYNGQSHIVTEDDTWHVKKIKPTIVELSKPVNSKSDKTLQINDLFLVIDKWMNFRGKANESAVTYGVNDYKIPNVFNYNKIKGQFILPSFKSAGKVFLSGSFNGWSTTQTPMTKASYGWVTEVNLKAGKYTYKYIIDGKWKTDPNNKLREDDRAEGYNSVVYCDNHLFELEGYRDARKVVVTGNFYSWNPQGLEMKRTSKGWALPIYLQDGTYAYKFIVDYQWMTDPANPSFRKDANGNLNSFLGIGEPYLFKLDGFTTAEKVILTGSFNHWNGNELVMDKTKTGWQFPYVVAPGNYEYKFIVDGKWIPDPANPFTSGSGDKENSFIALKANHIFELRNYQYIKTAIVTGSFNGWDIHGYRMIKQEGKWVLPLYLKPGKYTYKFVLDDTWILDPDNTLYEQNEYDTNNSVIWIE